MSFETYPNDKYSNMLPTPNQTQFLRACLLKSEAAKKAWYAWLVTVEDPIKTISMDTTGMKRLLPLLLVSLNRNKISVDKYIRTCLQAAYFREELRGKIYRDIFRKVTSALNTSNIKAIVLKGAAFSESVYPDPVCRHCHDIEILTNENELEHFLNLIMGLGFLRASKIINPKWENISFIHKTGLPLIIRRYLFRQSSPDCTFSELWSRSINQRKSDVLMRILSPADNLLHICTNALFHGSSVPIGWVCDAWFIIDCYPHLDWNFLSEFIQQNRLELPLLLALGYLAEDFEAPIPSVLLDRLRATASRIDGNFHECIIKSKP